jgi:hypothetical protein
VLSITTLTDNIANASITNANTGGTGALAIGGWTDASMIGLALNGNVALTGTFLNATGITVAGSTDHAPVTLSLGNAGAGLTNTVILGNGIDSVTDATTAGAVHITLGTSNGDTIIALSGGNNATFSETAIVGAHTAADNFSVSAIGANTTFNTVITGAQTGDVVTITDHAVGTVIAQVAAVSVAAGITAAFAAAGLHAEASFTFGGNTYMAESTHAAGAEVAGDTVIELVGLHTFGTATGAGAITLLS